MLLSISPKYAVPQVVGHLKGKNAIYVERTFGGQKRNFIGPHFWTQGHWVSIVGRDDDAIREYIRQQEARYRRLDQPILLHDQVDE
tara:strand:- start:543 stop:800 length:258 start_codon:yes stop_codon:yes gene_type:complete